MKYAAITSVGKETRGPSIVASQARHEEHASVRPISPLWIYGFVLWETEGKWVEETPKENGGWKLEENN